jgi:hypothetical protein
MPKGRKLTGLTPEQKRQRQLENMRAWRRRNPERQKALTKAWEAAHPDYRANATKERRKRDYVKVKARETLRVEVREGRIKRGACEICGEPSAEAHHPDYAKPLDVIWLCGVHHRVEHDRLRQCGPGVDIFG